MGDLGYQTWNKAMQLLARKSGGIGSLETIVNGHKYGTKNILQTGAHNNSLGFQRKSKDPSSGMRPTLNDH